MVRGPRPDHRIPEVVRDAKSLAECRRGKTLRDTSPAVGGHRNSCTTFNLSTPCSSRLIGRASPPSGGSGEVPRVRSRRCSVSVIGLDEIGSRDQHGRLVPQLRGVLARVYTGGAAVVISGDGVTGPRHSCWVLRYASSTCRRENHLLCLQHRLSYGCFYLCRVSPANQRSRVDGSGSGCFGAFISTP